MIDLGSIAGLYEREHELHAYCWHCDRWTGGYLAGRLCGNKLTGRDLAEQLLRDAIRRDLLTPEVQAGARRRFVQKKTKERRKVDDASKRHAQLQAEMDNLAVVACARRTAGACGAGSGAL